MNRTVIDIFQFDILHKLLYNYINLITIEYSFFYVLTQHIGGKEMPEGEKIVLVLVIGIIGVLINIFLMRKMDKANNIIKRNKIAELAIANSLLCVVIVVVVQKLL